MFGINFSVAASVDLGTGKPYWSEQNYRDAVGLLAGGTIDKLVLLFNQIDRLVRDYERFCKPIAI
jgi:hypothetical protein